MNATKKRVVWVVYKIDTGKIVARPRSEKKADELAEGNPLLCVLRLEPGLNDDEIQIYTKGAIIPELIDEDAVRELVPEGAELELGSICFKFPCVKGTQAGRAFYTAQVPMQHLVRLFEFNEDDVPPELRAQRELNEKRAEAIAEYIISNRCSYVLPAITASVDKQMRFDAEHGNAGTLTIPLDALLLINDGQHRRRGIELAIEQDESLRDESIGVVLYYDQGLLAAQQMFSDINSNAKPVSGALNSLYDHRCQFNALCQHIIHDLKLGRYIEWEKSSASGKSMKLWSIVGFKKFISNLTGIRPQDMEKQEYAARYSAIRSMTVAYLEQVFKRVPMLSNALLGGLLARELRESFITGHQVFLEALGMALHQQVKQTLAEATNDWPGSEYEWQAEDTRLNRLEQIPAYKTEHVWEDRCISMGRMQKNAIGVKSTAWVICDVLGVPATADMNDINEEIERKKRALAEIREGMAA